MARSDTRSNTRRIQALASSLAELRARGSPRRFLPPAGDAEIAAFEAASGGPLPDDVRAFYREVTAGEQPTGVAPILGFEQARATASLALGESFPFTDAEARALMLANQSRPPGAPAVALPGPPPGPLPGALPVMDHGCEVIDVVVLRGPQRGTMWQRWDAGWTPLYVVKKGQPQALAFLAWLEAEIGSALKTAPPRITSETRVAHLMNLRLMGPPLALREASALEVLWLTGNRIAELPGWIGELTQLRELRVGNNPLSALPDRLAALAGLEVLDVSLTQLTALPSGIGALRSLRKLLATSCALTALPDTIGDLAYLAELDVANNALTELPARIEELVHLRVLRVANNPLRTLPAALERLPVEALDLEGLPELAWDEALAVVSRMPSLTSLRIRQSLPALPPAVARLTNLRTLRLVGMGLTEVPEAVTGLPAVETLSLDQNLLTTLPDAIGAMPALKTVVLFSNPIAPEEVARLRARFGHLHIEHF